MNTRLSVPAPASSLAPPRRDQQLVQGKAGGVRQANHHAVQFQLDDLHQGGVHEPQRLRVEAEGWQLDDPPGIPSPVDHEEFNHQLRVLQDGGPLVAAVTNDEAQVR